ncbi:MAG: metallophosphoesterase [Ignavibacteria bacterium]
MKNYILLFVFFLLFANSSAQIVKFAVIGDYGNAGTNELSVSNLVKSWNPEFIITLGDNNYSNGEASTIDMNIGQYYHEFIFPYTGSYGSGDTVNRFFPSLGNHDWYTTNAQPYLDYFTLPGNERYYNFVKGNVNFFVIDSDSNEPDGRDSNSVQALWLKNALKNSSSDFNIVYFHHPAYSSSSVHGSAAIMQWPFKNWGASLVMAGHDHTYERIVKDGFTYIVNGLGGKSIYAFGTPIDGSLVRYNNNYGAMIINSYEDSLVSEFFSISNSRKDIFTLNKSTKSLALTILPEGLYDQYLDVMTEDTVRVYLRNSVSPYTLIDSSVQLIDENGNSNPVYNDVQNATEYYIVIKHRNSIETWSGTSEQFMINKMEYDFTMDSTSAYGNNLVLKGSKYCIYSGDVNQDGIIDASDNTVIDNNSYNFVIGYESSDLNGDGITDLADLLICENNAFDIIVSISP